jgi:hypothetical protein
MEGEQIEERYYQVSYEKKHQNQESMAGYLKWMVVSP